MLVSPPSATSHPSVAVAARICADRGVNLTPLRRIVLEVLLGFHGPARAYELIRALQDRLGKQVGPPTVYRALDFLQQHGLVTRIESQNAFLPSSPDTVGRGAFLLCNDCGTSFQIDMTDLDAEFSRHAALQGFQIARRIIELQGICRDCQRAAADHLVRDDRP
ncbi:Fur family transcriptional regulator [Paracoccus onchidii]|uniref:Fur family transcriptional regulator n=1 Tax=Paracoccus onchidii TaxID=3017813 RepID=UPI0038CDC97C